MSTVDLAAADAPFVLVVDIGTSSLRVMVYDAQAHEVEGLITRHKYKPDTTDDGGSTLDARAMFDAFTNVIDEILTVLQGKIEIAAMASSTLASNMLALDADGEPLTPVYLYADTRNAREVEQSARGIRLGTYLCAHGLSPAYSVFAAPPVCGCARRSRMCLRARRGLLRSTSFFCTDCLVRARSHIRSRRGRGC